VISSSQLRCAWLLQHWLDANVLVRIAAEWMHGSHTLEKAGEVLTLAGNRLCQAFRTSKDERGELVLFQGAGHSGQKP